MVSQARERLLTELSDELDRLRDEGLLRRLTTIEAADGPVVRIDGREVVSWCSNDYLGLSTHPALTEAAATAASEWGVGARASRLLSGTTRWHSRLEESLASWFGAEAAIVYPSGYLANLGTLAALASSEDLILVDRLAHASLVDAARATRATLRVFHHNNAEQVARLLARASEARRRVIVTEGLFSMEGDLAPLATLIEIAEAHEALVYVDDAHGAFVLGATGRGAPEAAGVAHARLLYMGTLGKALGCQGGFVVGPQPLIDVLRNRARTFIYSTALAVPVAAAAVAALELLRGEPRHRDRLWDRAVRLRQSLSGIEGLVPQAHAFASQIIPVLVGRAADAQALSQELWDRECWAPAIRPPTVPEGAARLRLSVTALHTDGQIDALTSALRECHPGVVHSR